MHHFGSSLGLHLDIFDPEDEAQAKVQLGAKLLSATNCVAVQHSHTLNDWSPILLFWMLPNKKYVAISM